MFTARLPLGPLLNRYRRCFCTALVAAACISPCRAAGAAVEYTIEPDPALTRLDVGLCFDGGRVPRELRATASLASALSAPLARAPDGSRTPLTLTENRIVLAGAPVHCVDYEVSVPIDAPAERPADVHRHDGAVIIALDRFLLRPANTTDWRDTRLNFDLPAGFAVSAPGSATGGSAAGPSFELQRRPQAWHGDVAIGRMSNSEIPIAGAALRVSVLGAAPARTAATLSEWVRRGAQAIAGVYGRFPVDELQVLVIPLPHNDDPVPWGEVVRGGGDAVHLYVDGTRTLAELNANWVLCHELSHLLHPYVASGGSWLPEGIASYYQNVARARSGLIEPRVAWQKLESGFARGRKQTAGKRTLADATGAMMRRGEYMRVYWSGAAIALIADVELRRRTSGVMSLDHVLEQLRDCCLPAHRRWRPRELMEKMDAVAGADMFMRLYERYVSRPVFPDVDASWSALGLGPDAPVPGSPAASAAAKLRRAIMGGD